jgi:hypothetical protein
LINIFPKGNSSLYRSLKDKKPGGFILILLNEVLAKTGLALKVTLKQMAKINRPKKTIVSRVLLIKREEISFLI